VAAHIARAGVCAQLVATILGDSRHSILASEFILDEFSRTLIQKLKLTPAPSLLALNRWRECIEIVTPAEVPPLCRDPDDQAILGTAKAAKADLLITIDKDLLILGSFLRTKIAKPGEAFALVRRPSKTISGYQERF
jgi:putative PIN family toxin of toxin-antitoxin system